MGDDLDGKPVAFEVGLWGLGNNNPNIKPIPTTRLRRRHPGNSSDRVTLTRPPVVDAVG